MKHSYSSLVRWSHSIFTSRGMNQNDKFWKDNDEKMFFLELKLVSNNRLSLLQELSDNSSCSEKKETDFTKTKSTRKPKHEFNIAENKLKIISCSDRIQEASFERQIN